MNKIYQSPTTQVLCIASEQLICESVPVSTQAVSNSSDIGFVKSDNSSRGSHSVWDDDWSK